MKIFVASSYSSQIDYESGVVFPEFKDWLENILTELEADGHTVFSALRADDYKVNNNDPASAFFLDIKHLMESDVVLALLTDDISAGVQTEIGYAVASKKKVVLAHLSEHKLAYFNDAMVRTKEVTELILPFNIDMFNEVLGS